jgi:hypothetical protein
MDIHRDLSEIWEMFQIEQTPPPKLPTMYLPREHATTGVGRS